MKDEQSHHDLHEAGLIDEEGRMKYNNRLI